MSEHCEDSRCDKSSYKSTWPSPFAWEYSGCSGERDIIALWATVGMVNTAIVLAAAEGIVAATDHCLLRQHGGSLVLTKAWDKSVLSRMEFEKLKDSTSAKLPVPDF